MSVYPPQTIFVPYRRPVRMFHYQASSMHVVAPFIPADYTIIHTVYLFGQEYYMVNSGSPDVETTLDKSSGQDYWGFKLPHPTIPLTVDIRVRSGSLLEEGTDYIVDKGVAWVPEYCRSITSLDISGAIDTWEGRARREWR